MYRVIVRTILLIGFPLAALLTIAVALAGDTTPKAAAATDPNAAAIAQNLATFAGTLDQIKAVDQLSTALPLQAKTQVDQVLQRAQAFADDAATRINALAGDAALTLASLDQRLDDLDNNGDSTSDIPLPGLTVDINGTVTPKTVATSYTVTLTWSLRTSATGPISLIADGIPVGGQSLTGGLTITGQATFKFQPAAADPNKFVITNLATPLAQVNLSIGADFGNTDPAHDGDTPALAVNVGLLGASAMGTADADISIGVSLHDSNGDNKIDTNELANTSTLFTVGCTSGQVHAHLSVSAGVTGLIGKLGSVSLDDGNVCDGLPVPNVVLGDLNEFRSLTPGDVINGLAELTTALKSLQAGSDLDLPFVKEGLSSVVAFNDKLVKFFVDNGFTDPAHPMDNITVDPAQVPGIDTLQELLPKLATALGLPDPNSLGLAWANDAVTFTVHVSADPGPISNAGTLDFGDQLDSVGMGGLTGTAKATIDPSYSLDLGLGIDLRPNLDLTDRFYFKTGTGAEITADAAVSADVDLTGSVALLSVTAKDSNPSGAVPLLQRKDSSKPMLSVQLDGRGDDRLTLSEIGTAVSAAQLPFVVTTNAAVPSTTLTVASSIAGTPLAAGTVTVSWPDIAVPASLSVTADGTFQHAALPFAYDPANPVGSISQLMKAARDAVVSLRGLIKSNGKTVADLPLVGRSLSDFDPILSELETKLDDIVDATSSQTLEDARAELAHVIATALGLPASAEPTLLTLEFQPATATARAAVIAHLRLGICTTDRTGAGCSKSIAQPSYPLNLQLGSTNEAVGLAGLTTDGTLSASFNATLSLDFGVELPTVTPGTGGGLPTVSGVPNVFVLDGSNFDMSVGVAGTGTLQATLGPATIELRAATANLAARFHLGLASPTGARLQLGSGAFSTWLNNIVPSTVHDGVHPSGCAGSADACASFPVFLNNNPLGTITFTAPDLLSPGGWTLTGVDTVLASVQSSDIVFDVLADGLQTLIDKLSAALHAVPTGTTIPLIGVDLTAGADVVSQITDGIVNPAIDLAQSLHSSATAGNARNTIRTFFIDHVGPTSSIPLLQDANNDGTVDANDVTVTLKCDHSGTTENCVDADSLVKLVSMEVRAPLGASVSGATPSFDIGFPGFRLASAGHLSGHASFTYNLAFGIDKERGFYIPTNGPLPELQVSAGAALPNVSGADNDLTGDIAFIPITGEDKHAGDDVRVSAGIDITGGDSDGHLGLQQLGTVSATPTISVCANVSMQIATALDNVSGGGMPKLAGTLNIRGGYTCDGSIGAPPGSGFSIGIDNVSVDVGSFVNKFIQPIVHDIHKVTAPLEPVVDAIRSPIPGVEEAAKLAGLTPPTWYGLFKTFNDLSGGGSLELIDRVITLVDVVKQLDANPTGSGSIMIGSFDLNPTAAAQPLPTDRLGELISGTDVPDGRSILDRLNDSGISVPALAAINEAQSGAGFSFPVWDHPSSLFGMLIGKDVTLAHFDAGKLEVSASFQAAFNIGPVVITIGGGAGIEGHAAVGYDTAGFRYAYKVLTDDDPTNNGVFDLATGLIQGFYIDDLDASGKDVPEIKFTGQLSVGAGVGVPGFNVRVEGGVQGEVDFDLKDPDSDGKIHFGEFVDELKINPNPICLFKVGAKVGAFIQVVFEALFISYTIPIADVVLYEQPDVAAFCSAPDPGLATKYGDGTLALATSDQPDAFIVDQTGPGTVMVSARGTSQEFTGVTRVFADGGAGADQIQVISHSTGLLPAILCGGAASDRLAASAGPASLYGDDGPGVTVSGGPTLPCTPAGSGGGDTLTGDAQADTLDGGPGNDVMVGGGGNDTLKGLAGNDTLRGGTGNDSLQGGTGDDTSDYADHTGGVAATAGTGGGQIGTTEHDTAPQVESIVGTQYDDDLHAPATGVSHIDGLAGNDTITGSDATDLLFGSDGNDVLRPGGGINQVIGGGGDDTFVNGVNGTDTFVGGAGFDTVDYSAATTPVNLSVDGVQNDGPGDAPDNVTEAEHLIGGSANDTISAASSNDLLEGRSGNDNVMGGGGNDVLDGGARDDRLEGGPGADESRGGPGFDTADYSNRTDALVISVDDVANDGAAPDQQQDNVRTDVEHVLGGLANDLINARTGADDVTEGGPGDDTIVGNGGTDRLDGGPGDDDLVGGSGVDLLTGDDGNDQMSGLAGNDRLEGGVGDNAYYGGAGSDVLVGGPGRDTLRGGPDADTISGNDGNDVAYGDAASVRADDGADTISGDNGNDRIYGGNGNDTIDGGLGNDTITGEGNNDTVNGSDGVDTLNGGAGLDHVNGGDGNDLVTGDDGNDVLTGGLGNDTLKGGANVDTLTGDEGDDILDGGDGNDTLNGGTNADQLFGGAGSDTATWTSRTEPLDLSVDGVADDGGASDTHIAGGSDAADSIDNTVETVIGGSGADSLSVATDRSYTLDGGAGDDTLSVASFVVRPQTLLGSAGTDSLTGGSGADVLDGGADKDTERGGAGDDRFAQGAAVNGGDVMFGGTGFDVVDYSLRTGSVSVTFDNVANDGEAGEQDNVRNDIEGRL
jgi:Ca2+-binding RTX toxin-like protein